MTITRRKLITLLPMLIYPIVVAVHLVGLATGHYAGWYPQTELASDIQTATLPIMWAAPLVLAWGWRK